MKRITVAACRAEEEERLLAGRTGGMTHVPVMELLVHDLAIGVIFINLKDAKSSEIEGRHQRVGTDGINRKGQA